MMARPITWRNVTINDGSSSAALGNTAANFGRSAQAGFATLNDQMQARIDQEDSRLTNEAISTALSGGPQVSDNRRVDANALQLSVERDLLGNRQSEAHVTDQETARLTQVGQGFQNDQDEFTVKNQEETLRLKRLLEQANLEDKQQQTSESKIRVEDLQRQVEEAARLRKSAVDQNEYLYGGGRDADLRADFDKLDHTGVNDLEKEADFAQYRDDAINQSLSNIDYGPQMANRFGMTVNEWTANTDEGAQWKAGREAAIASEVEEAKLQAKSQTVFNDGATAHRAGAKNTALYDPAAPGGISFGKSQGNISVADQGVVASDLGLDPTDDNTKEFMAKLSSEFKNPGLYSHVAKSIIGDSKEIPDNYASQIDGRAFDVNQRAEQLLNPTTYSTSGTPEQNLANSRSARTSGAAQPVVESTESAEVDVFDQQALDAAVTPDKAKSEQIRDTAVSSLQAQFDKLSGIKDDLSIGQGFEYRRLRKSIERIEKLKGTEKDGGLNNWQLNYIREAETEAQQLLNTIEGERRTALDRAVNR